MKIKQRWQTRTPLVEGVRAYVHLECRGGGITRQRQVGQSVYRLELQDPLAHLYSIRIADTRSTPREPISLHVHQHDSGEYFYIFCTVRANLSAHARLICDGQGQRRPCAIDSTVTALQRHIICPVYRSWVSQIKILVNQEIFKSDLNLFLDLVQYRPEVLVMEPWLEISYCSYLR